MSTKNQNLAARSFVPEYNQTLRAVVDVQGAFTEAFDELQMYDGVRENETAFVVKTSDIPVVMTDYDVEEDINDTRFGDATEIKYTNEEAKYDYLLKTNEAIDEATVNNDVDEAVADRMLLVGRKNIEVTNIRRGKFLSDNAGLTLNLALPLTDTAVLKLFNDLSKHFTNKGIRAPKTAHVAPDLYNAIVDHPLVSTGKNSTVNIDKNGIIEFKGFKIREVAENNFVEGDLAYATVDAVAIPFIGLIGSRLVTSERFYGFNLQSLAKGGNFVLDDNKVGIVRVKTEAISG